MEAADAAFFFCAPLAFLSRIRLRSFLAARKRTLSVSSGSRSSKSESDTIVVHYEGLASFVDE